MLLHPLFADLPGSDKTALVRACKVEFVKRGEPVVTAGAPLDGMLLVASGALRVETRGPDGALSTTFFLGFGDVYLETVHGDAQPAKNEIVAALASIVHRVPQAQLRATALRFPTFGLRLLQAALNDQQKLRKQLRRVTAASPEAAVGRTLYDLSTVTGAGSKTVDKRITQSTIAAFTGLSRERVNRTMRELEAKGLITRGTGGIVVDTSFSSTDFGSFETTPAKPLADPPSATGLPRLDLDDPLDRRS